MKTNQEILKRVRDLRSKLDLTQEQLGEKVGLPRTTITLIEQGKRKLSVEDMLKFCKALECKYEDLLPATTSKQFEANSQRSNMKEFYKTYKEKYQRTATEDKLSNNPLDEYLRETDPYYSPSANYHIRYEQ